jgi:hypothetical protein
MANKKEPEIPFLVKAAGLTALAGGGLYIRHHLIPEIHREYYQQHQIQESVQHVKKKKDQRKRPSLVDIAALTTVAGIGAHLAYRAAVHTAHQYNEISAGCANPPCQPEQVFELHPATNSKN